MRALSRLALLSVFALSFSPAVRADEVVIKIATVAPEGSPWADALNRWKKVAEKEGAGKLKIKVFLGGKLGDENETVLACKRGQIQAVGASTGALASQVPEFAVLELPYLFNNAAEADYILDNVVRDDIARLTNERGLTFGFWSENGFRSFGGKFPVATPDDLKNKKMRSQESGVHLTTYRTFGASPVPIPTTEALTSIQTGVVDGYDQTPLFTFAASWHTVSTHFSVTDHIYQPAAIVYNKEQYEKWPPEVKEALSKASATILLDLRKEVRAMTPLLIDNLGSIGLKVNVLSEEQRKPFKTLAQKARDTYMSKASKNEKALYKKITDALAAKRAGK